LVKKEVEVWEIMKNSSQANNSILRLAEKRLSSDFNKGAVDALSAFIANNPTAQYEDLVRKSLELGYNPATLIDNALGSVITDKQGLNLSKSTDSLLNEVYEKNPIPGDRYIIDPNNIKSKKAKQVASDLGSSEGIAVATREKGLSRGTPEFVAVKDAKDELGKMGMITSAGHELKHPENWMTRPDFNSKGSFGDVGHHYGPGTFESQELIKQVRDLPDDEKLAKEILKRAGGAKASSFKYLKSLPYIGSAIAGAAALSSPDASAAAADFAIPGGLESLGPSEDDAAIENPQSSPEMRRRALEALRK
jgi:hypothetical protein